MNPIGIIDKILGNSTKIAILRYMVAGQHATGRELAGLTQVSPPAVLKHLSDLVEESILVRTSVGSSHYFQLNRKNIVVQSMLLPLFGEESKIVPWLGDALQARLPVLWIDTILLYGSIARGDASAISDWDVLILCRDKKRVQSLMDIARKMLPEMREKLGSTLDVKIFSTADFCARYRKGETFFRRIYDDYLHSIVSNPLYGTSLTDILEAHGKKNSHEAYR